MLIGTVVLSFGAALGLSAPAFSHLFGFADVNTAMPLFVFLVALGIGHNIFLMTRVREEAERSGTGQGAITVLGATSGVITLAGAVLASLLFDQIVGAGTGDLTTAERHATICALLTAVTRKRSWPGRGPFAAVAGHSA